MLADLDVAVKVASWAAVGAGLTFAADADLHSVVDAGRDFDLLLHPLRDVAAPAALLARVGDRGAGTLARGAGGLLPKPIASWPNRLYRSRFSASERTSYASAASLNLTVASASPGWLSGWYMMASLR